MANSFPVSLNDWTANEVIKSAWADSIEEKLGIKLNDFIAISLKAMQGVSSELGL